MSTRILLIDDDAMLTETLALGLRKRGFEVTACTSAAQATRSLETEDFDVVVTDLNLQEVGGIELCARVVANRPDVPVIVLTGFRQPGIRHPRDPGGRLRLHQQARGARCPRHRHRARGHAPQPA